VLAIGRLWVPESRWRWDQAHAKRSDGVHRWCGQTDSATPVRSRRRASLPGEHEISVKGAQTRIETRSLTASQTHFSRRLRVMSLRDGRRSRRQFALRAGAKRTECCIANYGRRGLVIEPTNPDSLSEGCQPTGRRPRITAPLRDRETTNRAARALHSATDGGRLTRLYRRWRTRKFAGTDGPRRRSESARAISRKLESDRELAQPEGLVRPQLFSPTGRGYFFCFFSPVCVKLSARAREAAEVVAVVPIQKETRRA